MTYERITTDPDVMGGVPCIRGLRIPVASVVAMFADGMSADEILADLPSVILVRRLVGRRAAAMAGVILANLDGAVGDLEAGAIVVLGEDFVRIRRLPI